MPSLWRFTWEGRCGDASTDLSALSAHWTGEIQFRNFYAFYPPFTPIWYKGRGLGPLASAWQSE
jgi:hypothetical protein